MDWRRAITLSQGYGDAAAGALQRDPGRPQQRHRYRPDRSLRPRTVAAGDLPAPDLDPARDPLLRAVIGRGGARANSRTQRRRGCTLVEAQLREHGARIEREHEHDYEGGDPRSLYETSVPFVTFV